MRRPSWFGRRLAKLEDIELWSHLIKRATCPGGRSRGMGAERTCELAGNITIQERWVAWDEGRSFAYEGAGSPLVMRRNRTKAFGVPDMRTHDLRRTMRTFLGEQGVPDEVADRVLNHVRPGVGNQHYNHAKMLPQVRAALERWAAYVEAACRPASAKQCLAAT